MVMDITVSNSNMVSNSSMGITITIMDIMGSSSSTVARVVAMATNISSREDMDSSRRNSNNHRRRSNHRFDPEKKRVDGIPIAITVTVLKEGEREVLIGGRNSRVS